MSFQRYSVSVSPFDRYYDRFFQNSLRGKRFRIKLVTGESVEGTPTAGSIINPQDPNASFSFRASDDQMYRIPFSALKDAVPVEPVFGAVRTRAPNTTAGGDFVVEIAEPQAEQLLMAEGSMTISARIPAHQPYAEAAPAGTYQFLTVGGSAFSIKDIQRAGTNEIRLTVEPL